MADDLKSNALGRQRVVRVFISSTFSDMHEEREELVKRIFPQLRKMCEQRGITWCEVDLRWGISDEQKAEGKVLPICLEEIKRCRPFFIGLLGERYGWVPKEIPQELIEQEGWLAEHREKSVTELEIMHGVLKNPAMANHACFYLRDPAYVERIPVDKRADFVEKDSRARQRLSELKGRIRASGLAVRENYPDPQTLGRMVLEDLTAAINLEFPPEIVPEPLDREAAEHEAFALSRVGIYIGRQEYIDRLDNHATSDGQPLVILGESGVGKSALLANWALKYRESHRNELLLMHFIGASSYSADWAAMLRRIMGEFKRRFDIQQDIPDEPDELRDAFANWLHMAAAKGRIVLILDALNQLEDKDNAPDLVWLPPFIPENIRLVVSTLPGRPLDNLQKRDWPSFYLKPLEAEERKKLIIDYLAQYRKTLDPSQADFIASAEQTANPLYLRSLLEELRVFGRHEELSERIDYYLSAETIPRLYEKILERYEQDYERDRPNLVKDAMSLIWASRRGLSEAELLEMLGKDGEFLLRAQWSPLHLAAEQSLVSRYGLIGFFHDYLREAVRRRYLPAEHEQHAAHLCLADYFEAQEIGPRKIDELPWQLCRAKAWRRLYALLANLPFCEACLRISEFDVRAYWAMVESESQLRMVDAYRSVMKSPKRYEHHAKWIVALLGYAGHNWEASSLQGFLTERYRKAGDRSNLQESLGRQAVFYLSQGHPDEAMSMFKQQEQICRELGSKNELSASLSGQAFILQDWGRLDEAMILHKQQEQICCELGDKRSLLVSLAGQARVLYIWGRLPEAMELCKQLEQLCRELGNKDGLQEALHMQAYVLRAWGHLEEAMGMFKQQEQICRELGSKNDLPASLSGQAIILQDWGRWDEAMELYKEQERLHRELGNRHGLQESLGNQAHVLFVWGRLEEAMELYKQQEQICRELGSKNHLVNSSRGQANILYKQGRLEEAMELYKEQEQLYRELGNKDGLQMSLESQVNILYVWGRLEEAMELYKQQEQICRELGSKNDLVSSYIGQTNILFKQGRFEEAMELYKEQEQLYRELGNKNGLQNSLGNQALILRNWGRLDEAMELYKQQEQICRDLGNKNDLQKNLHKQALILWRRRQLSESMELYKQQEQICRELSNREGLWKSLNNQALILQAWVRLDEAMALFKQAEQLCRDLGNKFGVQTSLGNQAFVLWDRGRFDEAMALFKQQEQLCRELDDKGELAKSIANQAALLAERMGRPQEALPLAEEACRIVSEFGLVNMAQKVKSILNFVRAKSR